MKTLALVIFANQNKVNSTEVEKIRKAVKKDVGEKYRIKIFANISNDELHEKVISKDFEINEKYDDTIMYKTEDINNDVRAELCTHGTSISVSDDIIVIALN